LIRRDLIKQIAELAHLELTEEEIGSYTNDLRQILDYFRIIEELATEPTKAHPPAEESAPPLREDVACSFPGLAALLANAPRNRDGFFAVKKVIE